MSSAGDSQNQSGGSSRARVSSDTLVAPFPHPPHSKPLLPIYRAVRTQLPPNEARELLMRVYMELTENLEAYWGPPDAWHNLSINASRLGQDEAEYMFWLGGLHAWPEDVDLLCDILSEYTGPGNQHHSPALARTTWQILESLPRERTAPYWRFWAFGASYYAQIERNPQRGLDLLDEGLLYVKRDGIVDILRNYRAMLVDHIPRKKIASLRQLGDYQEETLKLLEEKYKLGIQLGSEAGYTLATELAKLYQERAASRAAAPTPSSLDARTVQQLVSEDLDKALTYLKIAEALYTGDPRHPVEAIYTPRIRILMAQGQYGDALRLLQALPEELQVEQSMATMRRLAILSTGGRLDDSSSQVTDQMRSEVLSRLFANEGTELEQLARSNGAVHQIIFEVMRRLQKDSDSE